MRCITPQNYFCLCAESTWNLMEPNSNSHEVYIKEEPWIPNEISTACKSEQPPCIASQNELPNSSTVKQSKKNITLTEDQRGFKVEIKEEPLWIETPLAAISCKLENPSDSDVELKSMIKDPAHEVPDNVAAEEISRWHSEERCRNNNDVVVVQSSASDSDETIWESHDPNIPQELEEPAANSNLIEKCKSGICGDCFTSPTDLKDHKVAHDEVKRRFKCQVCTKGFLRSSHLKQHVLIHSNKQHYKCDICNKVLSRAQTLKHHKLSHEGKSPHVCEVCNASFTQAWSLKQHKKLHEGKRPHICGICQMSFTQASNLRSHQLIHEGKRPHVCDICARSFTLASNLKQHKIITHEGKRPFSCGVCGKTFTKGSNLNQHKITHEGKRPFPCAQCNKSFTQASNLKKHKLTHN